MQSKIIVTLDVAGFHHYPYAPEEVSFLGFNHRHLFKIKGFFNVSHDNREIEFFMAKADIKEYINEMFGEPAQFEARSCEMIAADLLEHFKHDGAVAFEVWEDNENGARVDL